MPLDSDDHVSWSSINDLGTTPSRRRPGRRDDMSPTLIPLLRGSFNQDSGDWNSTDSEALTLFEERETMQDNLAPARGIIFGIALSTPIWAVFCYGLHLLLH
jgi:hypothetical protein